MSYKIDTDMVAAYLRAVQTECDRANKEIEGLEKFTADLAATNERLNHRHDEWLKEREQLISQNKCLTDAYYAEKAKAEQATPTWQTVDQVPPEGTRCVVQTKDGAQYFLEPINGRWMQNVVKWFALPD